MSVPNHLMRDLAPIPTTSWKEIDSEARERLTPLLAGRRLADWSGPGGWQHSAMPLGRTRRLSGPPGGVAADRIKARQRTVLPLAEFTVAFSVSCEEIADTQRGAKDPSFDDLAEAALVAAEIENRAIFHGWADAGIKGISEVSPHPVRELGTDCAAYPGIVARAVDTLRCGGIDGPYTLAIGPTGYTRIVETTEHGGYPLFEHLKQVLGGPIRWAPGVDGAIVASQRGGDFLLDVGQDLAVGYRHHDAERVHLYLEESVTFHVAEPDAAVVLS
jgi:uncharacterized linocin/CFP29 family protein